MLVYFFIESIDNIFVPELYSVYHLYEVHFQLTSPPSEGGFRGISLYVTIMIIAIEMG